MAVDTTCEFKSQARFRNKNSKTIKEMAKKTRFDNQEFDSVCLVYFKLQEELGPTATNITRMQFRSVLYQVFNMPEDSMIERIMVVLDKNITPYVTLETWLVAMSIYLRGTLNEKIAYCFAAYDIIGDGIIKRDQIIALMRNTIIKHQVEDVEEAVKDFVDIIIKKFDIDLDGAISLNDFKTTIQQNPALLETFGQCLPDRAAVFGFLTTFTHKINKL